MQNGLVVLMFIFLIFRKTIKLSFEKKIITSQTGVLPPKGGGWYHVKKNLFISSAGEI